jgi:cobalt/nickel transport system permease protein
VATVRIETVLGHLGGLNELAGGDTPLHRLDPRAKLITTLLFIVIVTSFHKHEVGGLLPLVLYPVVLIVVGDLPPGLLIKRMLLAAPFALFIGIFNPLLDRETLVHIGPLGVSGGWVSFASIMFRVALTVCAALILIATTGLEAVCLALARMKVPRVFAVQLLLLYRYLFVLIKEASRMVRAHGLRSFGRGNMGTRVYGSMVGQWLLRTLDRAQRVHLAMLCRGFDGEIRLNRSLRLGLKEILFVAGWSAFFIAARLYDIPQWIGGWAMEVVR